MEAQAAGAAAACRCRCIVESSCWAGGGGMANSSDEMDSGISVAVGTLCVVLREEKNRYKYGCWISQLQEWWLALTFDLRIHLSFRHARGLE
jgi:hypothetical protein